MSHRGKRHRADTRALLGDQWVAQVEEAPRPVEPEGTTSAYTPDRLKRSLGYADQALRYQKRKVSPITERLLAKHKANVASVLRGEFTNANQREDLIKDIINEERFIYTKKFLQVPDKYGWPDFIERLCELKRYEFAARYGDYSKIVCDDLKKTALELQTPYYHAISGWHNRWTDIAKSLTSEDLCWRRFSLRDPSVKLEEVKTHLAIMEACRAMGINFETTLTTVTMYADRNSLVHTSTDRLIEHGRWDNLKEVLVRDLLDIDFVTPKHLKFTIPILQSLINALIDRYWTRNSDNPRDQNLWNLKPQAVDLVKQLNKEREKKRENAERERMRVAADAAKKYKEEEHKYKIAHFVADLAKLSPPTGALSPPQKRPRTEEEIEEVVARNKKRHKEFTTLVRLGDNLTTQATDYVQKYKTINPPILDPALYFEEEADQQSGRETDAGSNTTTPAQGTFDIAARYLIAGKVFPRAVVTLTPDFAPNFAPDFAPNFAPRGLVAITFILTRRKLQFPVTFALLVDPPGTFSTVRRTSLEDNFPVPRPIVPVSIIEARCWV